MHYIDVMNIIFIILILAVSGYIYYSYRNIKKELDTLEQKSFTKMS